MVDQNCFNLTWKTNLCGIANAKQRDKNVTDIYGYFMELAVGLETFIFKDKDDFEDEVFGGFLKGRHHGKLHSTFFFLTQ